MNQPTEFADSVNLTKKVSPFHPHLQGMLWHHHNCNFIVLIIQDGFLINPRLSAPLPLQNAKTLVSQNNSPLLHLPDVPLIYCLIHEISTAQNYQLSAENQI